MKMNRVESAARKAIATPDPRNPNINENEAKEILAQADPSNAKDVIVLRSVQYLPIRAVGGTDRTGFDFYLLTDSARRQFDSFFEQHGITAPPPSKVMGPFYVPYAESDPFGWAGRSPWSPAADATAPSTPATTTATDK